MYQTRILITEILIAGLSVKYRWLLREGNFMQQSAKRKDPPAEPFSPGVEALLIADRDHSSPSLLRFMSRFNNSGSRAIFAAIRRASSGVSALACIASAR
jgi:hypothetical protein